MFIHGVSLNWGIDSTVLGVNGLFQSREHSYTCDSETVRDGGDTSVSKLYWDFRELATFTYVAFQPVNGFANATVDIPTLGQWVTLLDPRYPAIAGRWMVDEISTAGSNVSAVRVTLRLSRYPFINNSF